jgi:ribokinase
MYDVITVGSATIDVFARVQSELVKIKSLNREEELIAYPCGSKILIKELTFLTGGGGTNTAVSLRRQGLKVAYLGKIGRDTNSKIIVEKLNEEKIEFIGIRAKGCAGYSIILDSIEGDRTILTYKGVNNDLDFGEIKLRKIKTKWFYFSSMMERSFEALEKLAQFASENSIKIAFNPSNYLAEKGNDYLREILSKTNLLVLNMDEAYLLGGRLKTEDLIKNLMAQGPQMVVITDGKNGAYIIHEKYLYHVLTNEVKPIETTGAGDAFASTFLAAVIKRKTIEQSLWMAQTNAESVIMHQGAKTGLLSYKKILQEQKKNPIKLVKKKI